MNRLKTFVYSVLAGISIALGGTVFLSVENKVLGALLFTVGLFTVCTFGFYLFTGKVCYVFERDRDYAIDLPVIWLGNLCGTWLTAFAEGRTRAGAALAEKALALCRVKLDDSLVSILILAVLCNLLIFIAVDGYNKNPHELGKYLSLFFGVTVFILCGFEHCVANMYYFSMAGVWSWETLGCMLVMTFGNAAGGVIIPLLRGWKDTASGKKTDTRLLTSLALLTALEIVLSRFLSINTWNLRIGFSFVPIAMAAMLFGPLPAGTVAAVADMIGAILFPTGPFFPGFTITAFLTGLVLGFFLREKQTPPRVAGAVLINQLVLGLLLNTFWISLLYGSAFVPLLFTRIGQCAILIPVQFVVILVLRRAMTGIRRIRA